MNHPLFFSAGMEYGLTIDSIGKIDRRFVSKQYKRRLLLISHKYK